MKVKHLWSQESLRPKSTKNKQIRLNFYISINLQIGFQKINQMPIYISHQIFLKTLSLQILLQRLRLSLKMFPSG